MSQFRSTSSQNFSDSYQNIVTQARQLTQSFQIEIGKWQSKHYDNTTMVKITNNYLPKFQNLINTVKSLQATPEFEKVSAHSGADISAISRTTAYFFWNFYRNNIAFLAI
jgi:hypothetical protein